jgi:AraC-like DNA-binding protein
MKTSTRLALLQQLEEAPSFLHDTQRRPVKLAELVSHVGLSQFHLTLYFEADFGLAPYAYHKQLRLNCARQAIRSGRSVTQAAFEAGYENTSSLSHAFTKAFGQSPSHLAFEDPL